MGNIMENRKELRKRRQAEKTLKENLALFERVNTLKESEIRRSFFAVLESFAPSQANIIQS